MKKLKNEMAAIIERDSLMYATPNGNMVICETINGKYEFPANMTEEILRRAEDMRATPKINLMDTSNRTQSCLLYMRDNPRFLGILLLIEKSIELTQSRYVGKVNINDIVSKLVKLNKDYKPHFRYTNMGWMAYDSNNRFVPIKTYLDLLPIVPKAWIKDIKL